MSTLPLVLLSLAFADPTGSAPTASAPDAAPPTVNGLELGRLEVEALMATEIVVDGIKLGQLWIPGEAAFLIPAGDHVFRAYTQGKPHDLPIHVASAHPLRVLVGRSGVSADRPDQDVTDATALVPVEFRAMGARGAMLHLDDTKHQVQPGQPLSLELTAGSHMLSVRSSDGTAIWASGVLAVSGAQPVVIHVTEGRLPDVSGGARFHTGSEG